MKVKILLLLLLILISGCGTSDRGCRSGDNFDGNSNEIESEFRNINDPYYKDTLGNKFDDRQGLIKWKDTGLLTNGKQIVVDVVGRWTPWGRSSMYEEYFYVDSSGKEMVDYRIIEKNCNNFLTRDVLIPSTGGSVEGRYILVRNPKKENGGYPCWISKGIGAYLLFRETSHPNPNSSALANESPVSGTIHLNDPGKQDKSRFEMPMGEAKDSSGVPIEIKRGMEIFAKINDAYYPDNYGSYQLNFIEGVFKRQKSPIFENCYHYIMDGIIDTSQKIFMAITNDSAFRNAVNAFLILYITIFGILFVMGFVQVSGADFFIRVFKIGLIVAVINPGAWEFFYNYLFRFYLEGIIEMCSIVVSGDKFDPDQPMAFLDDITNKILSPYIMNRISALLNANLILGLLWTFVFGLIFFFFGLMIILSFASFIISMILLYFITMTFPVFITCILFNFTRNLFQNWIDAILGYSAQVILTMVSLAFMAGIIQYEIQRVLGFKMCVTSTYHFNPFTEPDLEDLDSNSALTIKQWAPGEGDRFTPITFWGIITPGYNIYNLFVKVRYKFDYSIEKILVPPSYKEVKYRYMSLPFLEPDENFDYSAGGLPPGYAACMLRPNFENCHPNRVFPGGIGQEDHTRIVKMMFPEGHSYEFISFLDMIAIIILIFVSWRVNIDTIPAMSYNLAILQKDFIPPQMFGMTSMQGFYKDVITGLDKLSKSDNTVISWMGKLPLMVINPDAIFAQVAAYRKNAQLTGVRDKVYKTLGINDLDKKLFGVKSFVELDEKDIARLKTGDSTGKITELSHLGARILQFEHKVGEATGDFFENNRFARAAGQVGHSISDAFGIASEKSKAANEAINKENLRVWHNIQDQIGGRLEYGAALFDKFGANGLKKAIDPTHSVARDYFGGYNYELTERIFGDKKFSDPLTRDPGLFENVANAIAGDYINAKAIEKGWVKEGELVFEEKEKVDGDFQKLKMVSSALGQFFQEDASKLGGRWGLYDRIADLDYDEYIDQLNRIYDKNRVDTRNFEAGNQEGGAPSGAGQSSSGPGGPGGGGSDGAGAGAGAGGNPPPGGGGGSDLSSSRPDSTIPPGGGTPPGDGGSPVPPGAPPAGPGGGGDIPPGREDRRPSEFELPPKPPGGGAGDGGSAPISREPSESAASQSNAPSSEPSSTNSASTSLEDTASKTQPPTSSEDSRSSSGGGGYTTPEPASDSSPTPSFLTADDSLSKSKSEKGDVNPYSIEGLKQQEEAEKGSKFAEEYKKMQEEKEKKSSESSDESGGFGGGAGGAGGGGASFSSIGGKSPSTVSPEHIDLEVEKEPEFEKKEFSGSKTDSSIGVDEKISAAQMESRKKWNAELSDIERQLSSHSLDTNRERELEDRKKDLLTLLGRPPS